MHVMAKSAKKGRRDAEDAEVAEACVVACMVVSMITLPLVVALFCSCCRKVNFQALVCSPTRRQRRRASARGVKTCEKKGRCDAEDAADEIRRENGEKTTQLYLNSSFFILHSSFFILHSSFFILHSL